MIMFYNGFNLLLDIIFVAITYKIAFSAGFNRGYWQAEDDNIPF